MRQLMRLEIAFPRKAFPTFFAYMGLLAGMSESMAFQNAFGRKALSAEVTNCPQEPLQGMRQRLQPKS